uniref:Uncharacterized protein n=2 Tax=Aegilops tauschii subsp. strangulata TaxID=200361 RepID=A0A453GQ37_AEGTS
PLKGPTIRSCNSSKKMAENAAEVKQTPQAQVGEKNQAAEKSEKKAELKPDEAKKLIEFMEKKYDDHVAKVDSFDDFYHAIYELIQKFCEERGQVQYRIPPREKLQEVYTVSGRVLTYWQSSVNERVCVSPLYRGCAEAPQGGE